MAIGRMAVAGLMMAAGLAPGVAMAQAPGASAASSRPGVIDLWTAGKTAFGVFVPDESPAPRGPNRGPAVYTVAGGQALAKNPDRKSVV